MPACLTHYYFAQTVLEGLSKDEKVQACAYAWGAQGPDFLFCHRYFPWMKGRSLQVFGHRLHSETKPSITLGAMRDFLARRQEPAYRWYVRGFLCHYALDSLAHPYVNALAARLLRQRPWENTATLHGEIEASLDAIVLRRETGMLPSEVSLKQMFPKNEPVQRYIAKLYSAVLLSVYGFAAGEEELLQATRDAHFTFLCLNDRTGLKRRLFQKLEKGKPSAVTSHLVPLIEEGDVDYANLSHTPWGEEQSDKSFFQLFEEAAQLAHRLITQFDEGDLARLTGERPFG